MRKKRIAEDFALCQRIQSHIDDPVEPPSLPGTGLLEPEEREEKPLAAPPTQDEWDLDMTLGDHDDEISALPLVPGSQQHHTAPQAPIPNQAQDEEDNQPSVQDLADQIDEVPLAAHSAGNRLSIRPPLRKEWRTDILEASKAESSDGEQQAATVAVVATATTAAIAPTEFSPFLNVWSEPGLSLLPDLWGWSVGQHGSKRGG